MEYGDDATRRLHQKGISYGKGFDKQALMRLNRIKAAVDQRDLAALRGNRFEKLKGDRAGSYSIRINDQWRITFRIVDNRALDVMSRTTTEGGDDDDEGEPGHPPG